MMPFSVAKNVNGDLFAEGLRRVYSSLNCSSLYSPQ